jgi:uncharacterized protein (DUF39 family)
VLAALIVTAGVTLEFTVTIAVPVKSEPAAAHLVSLNDVIKYVLVDAGETENVYGLDDTEIGLAASV